MSKKRHLHLNGVLEVDGTKYTRFGIFESMMIFTQNNKHHPENNLFFHVWQVARQLEKENINLWLAAVFHDVGKLTKFQIREDGQKTFYGHDTAGANYVLKHFNDYEVFNRRGVMVDKIAWLIQQHIRILSYEKMGSKKRKAFNTHKWWKDLKKLREADEKGRLTAYDLKF